MFAKNRVEIAIRFIEMGVGVLVLFIRQGFLSKEFMKLKVQQFKDMYRYGIGCKV